MKVILYNENIIYLEFPSQKELAMTFVRPQEFYESDLDVLQGKVFSFEFLIDCYTNSDGKFEYFHSWRGYNIPGAVLEDFFNRFESFTNREMKLRMLTQYWHGKDYYVIAGSVDNEDVIDHELVHAHYYLNKDYQTQANLLINSLHPNTKMVLTNWLKQCGYADHVINDEINAYMSTSSQGYIEKKMEMDIPLEHQIPFIELAESVLGRKIDLVYNADTGETQ